MRLPGLILIAAALFLPAIWFAGMTADHHPIAVFSQYLGTVAIIAMGIVQLLATRWHGLETVFGGLDRIYVLHKWLGIGALAMILAHDTIDAELSGVTETVLSELGETLGEISLYGLLILVTMTIATFIPYHLWKWTHKFMGAFFAASAIHYLLVIKPFGVWEPVGLYVNAFCVLGIVCYAYTLVPFGRLQGRRGYRVTAVEQTGGAVAMDLAPAGSGLPHRAGQFVFLGFQGGEGGPAMKEVHPFTVSSAPREDRSLRLTVKPLGRRHPTARRPLGGRAPRCASPAHTGISRVAATGRSGSRRVSGLRRFWPWPKRAPPMRRRPSCSTACAIGPRHRTLTQWKRWPQRNRRCACIW